MDEQCSSSSADLMQSLNEDRFMASVTFEKQATSSAMSFPFNLEKWAGFIQMGSLMRFNECMDFIAKVSGIQNPMDGHMQRIFSRISTNLTNELLKDLLDDYADLFKIIFIVIPFDDNMRIDHSRTSIFTGASRMVTGQPKYQQRVCILYNCWQQSFAPLYFTHTDGSFKVCFDDNDEKSICKEISVFIDKWNCEQYQGSTSEMNNIVGNNDGITHGPNSYNTNAVDVQPVSTSTTDKDIFMSARKVIKNHLQLVSQLITQMGPQFDRIQLFNKSIHAVLNNFDRLSDQAQIEMVIDEIISISEDIRIAAAPNYEEEVEYSSSMEIKDDRHCAAPSDAEKNLFKKIMSVQQKTSRKHKPSSRLQRPETMANVQKASMLPTQYAASKVLIKPTPYQHIRMFSELATGICPLIQAGGKDASQQTYVEIEVPNEDGIELYARVGANTVQKVKHPFKSVVPPKPTIDTSTIHRDGERSCLKCDKNDFDPDLEYTYLPISHEERMNGRKEILAHLINWKRHGIGLKNRVQNENLHLCKLEFCLCIRNGPGKYQPVSLVSYSSIIEEGDGPVNINADDVQLKELCERGGQKIILPISVDCLKRGFRILCNAEELNERKFKIHQKQLLIISPPQSSNNTNLHLEVLRNEYDDELERNTERTLYEHTFNYVSHDKQPSHICSEQNFTLANIKS